MEDLDFFLVKYLAYFNYKKYSGRIKLSKNDNVLEIGCGTGNLSRFLAKKISSKCRLYCIDKENYLPKSLQNLRNVFFQKVDFFNFRTMIKFDAIIICYLLHDIPKEKRRLFLNKVYHFMKPRSFLYIREPTRKEHGISRQEIESLMTSYGLFVISSSEENSFPLSGKVYEGIFQKGMS